MTRAKSGNYATKIGYPYREGCGMTTVLIIVCIVVCIGVVLAIVSHLGVGIARDRAWRGRIRSHHARRGRRDNLTT